MALDSMALDPVQKDQLEFRVGLVAQSRRSA